MCLQTRPAAAAGLSEHNEQKRLRCSSPTDPYCLSEEEEEVCEEEKPELLLKERESSRPPRLLCCFSFHHLKVLKRQTFVRFSVKRQNFFLLLCSSSLHPGEPLFKVSHPSPQTFQDHPGPPGCPWGAPSFCRLVFFPLSFIQDFLTGSFM